MWLFFFSFSELEKIPLFEEAQRMDYLYLWLALERADLKTAAAVARHEALMRISVGWVSHSRH